MEKPILYYSNYCKFSQGIIDSLSHTQIKDDVHYMNIDDRIIDQNRNIFIRKNHSMIPLPQCIDSVPSLLLLNDNNKVLIGNEIRDFIFDRLREHEYQSGSIGNEPVSYDFSNMYGVVSDSFSFLDQSADEMAAKGDGGLRQLYNYARFDMSDAVERMNTPQEDTEQNSFGSIESLIAKRNAELKSVVPPPSIMARH